MLRIINVKNPVKCHASPEELAAGELSVPEDAIEKVRTAHLSVDARKRHELSFVYTLLVSVKDEEKYRKNWRRNPNVSVVEETPPPVIEKGNGILPHRPLVIGTGPAGLICALYLAEAGYEPIVLERGADVDTRSRLVASFWNGGSFDPVTNVQFGEGGAGTFSDGKLTTRVTHPLLRDIARRFVEFGAPPDVLWQHKPHVGTDILRGVVRRMRERVIDLGGEVHFLMQATDFCCRDHTLVSVTAGGEEWPAEAAVLAIGHSARDTYETLLKRGIAMEAKPFAAGIRIEHPQEMIDWAQYRCDRKEYGLPPADYNLTYHDRELGRACYSFCMCPGGCVVAAASEEGRLVTNGMSYHARDSGIANSALVVNVTAEDCGSGPLDGIAFQRHYEEAAYAVSRSYRAPAQTVGDFLSGRMGRISPYHTYRPGTVPADIHKLLPGFITETLERSIRYFDRKIHGFASEDAGMTGVEMRTSAPVRILRGNDRQSINIKGLYPAGEGAGYAGGIMSAALDGAETAMAIIGKYRPFR